MCGGLGVLGMGGLLAKMCIWFVVTRPTALGLKYD